MENILTEIAFLRQRFTAGSILDILLVALIIFALIKVFRMNRSGTLLRGFLILIIIVGILTFLTDMPAFSWIISKTIPAVLIMIPILFTQELRRMFDKLGRIRSFSELFSSDMQNSAAMLGMVDALVKGTEKLANRSHGALIVLENKDSMDEYLDTGVKLDAKITPELLLQIFYPNTPLHDGAVIIRNGRIHAASCVMPLSTQNSLEPSPERHMGLRHRAALGVCEATDCIALVVSEETGTISYGINGKLTRNVSPEMLKQMLNDFYKEPEKLSFGEAVKKAVADWRHEKHSDLKKGERK